MQTSLTDQLYGNSGENTLPSLTDQLYAPEPAPSAQSAYNFEPHDMAKPYMDLVGQYEQIHGLPKNYLASLLDIESGFKTDAIGPKTKYGRAKGIAQIMEVFHPDLKDPFDPEQAIPYAAGYLKKMYDRFGDWELAAAAYNWGESNLARQGALYMPGETRNYLSKLSGYLAGEPEEGDVPPPVQASIPSEQKEQLDKIDPKKFYQVNAASPLGVMSPALMARMGLAGMGPQPEGGFNEQLIPLDKNGNPYTEDPQVRGKVGEIVAETFSGLKTLATHPMEVIRGGLDFALSVPGFITGMLGAVSLGGKELMDQMVFAEDVDLNQVYNVMGKAMEEGMAFYEPTKEALIGQRTPESELATQVLMAPLSTLSYVGHQVAAYEGFEGHPNIQGAAKFSGDILGMMAMGLALHRGSGKSFAKESEGIVEKATRLMEEDQVIKGIPNEIVRKAQEKVAATKKKQLELEAKRLASKITEEMIITEEIGRQAEAVARAKIMPVVERPTLSFDKVADIVEPSKPGKLTAQEVKDIKRRADTINVKKSKPKAEEPVVDPERPSEDQFVSKKGNVYEKIGGLWYDAEGKKVTNHFVLKAIAKAKGETVKAPPKKSTQKPEVPREPKVSEPVTDTDRVTGTKTPALEGDKSPFAQDATTTNAFKKLYEERGKAVMKDPDLFVQKLINDVNRWRHGDESININVVKETLSQLALRGNELRGDFINGSDFFAWKENVSDAAAWARDLVRLKNKQSVKVSPDVMRRRPSKNQLNMMIPLDQVPDAVLDVMQRGKLKLKDVFRNRKLFNDTGFWMARDGKWRYELDDSKLAWYDTVADSALNVKVPLDQAIHHPTLFKSLPGLKDVTFQLEHGSGGTYYKHKDKLLHVQKVNNKDIAHELQHAINNNLEAFTGGSRYAIKSKEYSRRFKKLLPHIKDEVQRTDLQKLVNKYDKMVKDGSTTATLTEWVEKEFKNFANSSDNPLKVSKQKLVDFFGPMDEAKIAEGYMRIPGEMEARVTAERFGMTAEQRSRIPPWDTLDRLLKDEWKKSKEYNKEFSEGYKSAGHKLYSGDPSIDAMIRSAKKVSEYTKKARGMKAFKPAEAARRARAVFNRTIIDRSGNIRRDMLKVLGADGYEVVQKMYLSKGSNSLASLRLRQMQKEVYSGLSRREKVILDNLILSRRIVDISKYKTPKQVTLPEGMTFADFINYEAIFQYLEKLTPKQAEKLLARSEAYFEWMRVPLKDMLDAQLITQKEFDLLSAHNYRRTKLVDVYDSKHTVTVGGKERTVYDSGVEPIAKGRDTDIYEPSSEVMALEVFNRAYGRVLNNEANLALLEVARKHENNPFVKVKTHQRDRIPSGWDRVYVMEGGKRKSMYVSPEVAKEWIISSPELSYNMSQLIRLASGSPVLRTMATGVNWGFALANLPRDVMHTWFTARRFTDGKWKPVYNPNLPIFGLQIGADLARVFTDAATKGPRYQKYIEEGGGMEFLTHQGRILQRGKHLEGPLDKAYNFLGHFGETSEIMTRLAIRDRVIRRLAKEKGLTLEQATKNKDITREATFIARDYMDFGQGGGVTKALDNGFPYLNASIQGTRGLIRSFKPGSGSAMSSTYKLIQFAGVVTGTAVAAWAMAPKTMKNMEGNVDNQNNLIIPLGDQFGFVDSEGQMRYPYIKIPLDPGQKFFKTFFEGATAKMMGREVDVNQIVDSLKEQSPVGVTELPPSISAGLGYVTNKDFWLNEDIWTKTKEPFTFPNSKEEFIPGKTEQIYQDIGQATGLSPERTQYAIEELVTNGTVWSYLLGEGYEAFRGLDKRQKEQHLAMALDQMPVVKRFFGVTNPYSKHSGKIDDKAEAFELERWIQNREMDRRVDGYLYENSFTVKEIEEYAKSHKDKDTYDRLMDRFKFEVGIKDLPEKSFWRRIKQEPTRVRAEMFVERLTNANEEEAKQLWEEYGIVNQAGGVVSPEFRDAVREIMQERNQVR